MLCVLLGVLILSSCSSSDQNTVTLNVYNWGEYIDPSVLDTFESETGIKVNYQTFANNEEMYAKIKSGGASYDVIFPSDYMIGRMIEEGMLEKLDFSNIPNYEFIADSYKNTAYDPKNEYSVLTPPVPCADL
jgi:spermidine/putrescine transport system substrate-binding protein